MAAIRLLRSTCWMFRPVKIANLDLSEPLWTSAASMVTATFARSCAGAERRSAR